MIRTKTTINGTEIIDYLDLRVERNMDNFNSASNFNMILDSPHGRHSGDFTIGKEVVVKADKDATPTTNIFTGILEDIKFQGEGARQRVVLSGRDYSARLMDITVKPSVFTNIEISQIVTTILTNNNVPDITTTNVDTTTTTLSRIAFNHISIFDAIKQLAELSNFIFWVDENKDLHFGKRKNLSSGITLNNTNTTGVRFDTTRKGMANQIWVYGDRYLSGEREIINFGSPLGGSVATLLNKPHNTFVEKLGSSLKGGILGLTQILTSGPQYLVSFHDKQLIFVSGTEIGYNSIPASGGSILVRYDKELPVVKFGQNDTSINLFGPKELIIKDKQIRDPQTALDIVRQKVTDADPLNKIEADYKGFVSFNPGQTIGIVIPDFDLNETIVSILNVTYIFNKNTIHSEKVIKLRLSKKILDITDKIKDIDRRLEAIESQDTQDSDVITRLIVSEDKFKIVGSNYNIMTRTLGSSFLLGITPTTTGPTFGARLGSIVASGISFLGDSRSSFTIVASGGNNYDLTGSYDTGGGEEEGGLGILSFG